MNFADLGLSAGILSAVEQAGYTEPTPIQEKAIPVVLQGRDVMGCAQTGTGKTASFALPMIDILASGRARARMPRALILEPTRELAAQVAEAFLVYSKNHKLEVALLIGGVSMDEQNKKLGRGADVLIATPGRLLDHADRGQVMLRGVKILVIDETDRMLDMGFIPDVQRIAKLLPPARQTLFFSATLDAQIRKIGADFVTDPKEISVAPPASLAASVRQALVRTTARGKPEALRKLVHADGIDSAIVFLNRKRDADSVVRALDKTGQRAAAIHGDLPQSVRTDTLNRFKKGEVQFLVASDVAARGLDIEALPYVVNFDVPNNPEDYVHRIGRTARAGRSGTAFTLVTREDAKALAAIVALTGIAIPEYDAEEEPAAAAEKTRQTRIAKTKAPAKAEPKAKTSGKSDGGSKAKTSKAAPKKAASAMTETKVDASAGTSGRKRKRAEPGSKTTAETKPKQKSASKSGAAKSKLAVNGSGRRAKPPPEEQASSPQPKSKLEEQIAGVMGGHVPAFLLRPVPSKR
jgi:superfamily II DNA/RNA helicase